MRLWSSKKNNLSCHTLVALRHAVSIISLCKSGSRNIFWSHSYQLFHGKTRVTLGYSQDINSFLLKCRDVTAITVEPHRAFTTQIHPSGYFCDYITGSVEKCSHCGSDLHQKMNHFVRTPTLGVKLFRLWIFLCKTF